MLQGQLPTPEALRRWTRLDPQALDQQIVPHRQLRAGPGAQNPHGEGREPRRRRQSKRLSSVFRLQNMEHVHKTRVFSSRSIHPFENDGGLPDERERERERQALPCSAPTRSTPGGLSENATLVVLVHAPMFPRNPSWLLEPRRRILKSPAKTALQSVPLVERLT